jgi:ABC-type nitrate/sulfonate/bicarbonate transport system substrate-binding protein
MSASRGCVILAIAGLLLLTSIFPVSSDPCCIIVVPPPPPPPRKAALPPPIGLIAAQLPIFAAAKRNTFVTSLNVKIDPMNVNQAVETVLSSRGVLGLATVNNLAQRIARTKAPLEITAVMIKTAGLALYTRESGMTKIQDLRGKRILIQSEGSLGHLFTVEALDAAGLSAKEVNFIISPFTTMADLKEKRDWDAVPLPIGTEVFDPHLKQVDVPKPSRLPSWALYASSTSLNDEVKEIRDLIKGLTEGLKLAKTDRELIREILANEFGITDRDEPGLLIEKYILPILPDSITPEPEGIERTLTLLRSIEQIKDKPVLFDSKRLQQLF